MVGENLGKKFVSIFVLVAVIVTLEHDTPFIIESGLGNSFFSCLTFCMFISWVVFESMLPRHCHVVHMFKRIPTFHKPYIDLTIYSYQFLPC
jgi:hypothetical protein